MGEGFEQPVDPGGVNVEGPMTTTPQPTTGAAEQVQGNNQLPTRTTVQISIGI